MTNVPNWHYKKRASVGGQNVVGKEKKRKSGKKIIHSYFSFCHFFPSSECFLKIVIVLHLMYNDLPLRPTASS
jgi:hypothetical protein